MPLVDAYGEVMPQMRRSLSNEAVELQDAVHDVCVRLRYLLRAVRNLTIDRHRSRTRSSTLFESFDAGVSATTSLDPERVVSGQERLGIISATIEQLPPRCREALRHHRFSGMSYVEIARQMKISPSMVEKHISEAMLRLSEALEQADSGDP
jgi:RNA polymerase sigma factor (sigma-70 family)